MLKFSVSSKGRTRLRFFNRQANDHITLLFAGKKGAGKSSTLGHLFNLAPAANSERYQDKPQIYEALLPDGAICSIVDMPGIAASITSQNQDVQHYRRWARRADVIVWVTQADVRAYKQDEMFFIAYAPMVRPSTRLVLAISKIDTLIAHDDTMTPELLAANDIVKRKVLDVHNQIVPHSWSSSSQICIVPYSVARDWNTRILYNAIFAPEAHGVTQG
jgi:predicted GTPase